MLTQVLIITYLPLIYLLIYTFSKERRYRIKNVSLLGSLLLLFILSILIATCPYEEGDRLGYATSYISFSNYYLTPEEAKDFGWAILNIICGRFLKISITQFFFIIAVIYVSSFYIFARKYIKHQYIGYFILLSVGALGFKNYGINTLRAGLGLALLYYSMYFDKRLLKLILLFFAVLIHKSMIIPIGAFLLAGIIQSKKYTYYIWFFCLVISIINIDLSGFFEEFGFIDNRIDTYVDSMSSIGGVYNKGFRVDFLIYSTIPMFIEYYYTKRIAFAKEKFYSHVFRAYLIANAVWLLVIRMAYSDRMAYLSWFMIPFITLYPVLTYPNKFKEPQTVVLFVMYTFIGVNVLLSMRSFL